MKTLLTTAAALLFAGGALAQTEGSEAMMQYDTDQDQALSMEEATQAGVAEEDFATFDLNQDDMWDEAEFTAYEEQMGGRMGEETEGEGTGN